MPMPRRVVHLSWSVSINYTDCALYAIHTTAEGQRPHGTVLHSHFHEPLVGPNVIDRDLSRRETYADNVDRGGLDERSDGDWRLVGLF